MRQASARRLRTLVGGAAALALATGGLAAAIAPAQAAPSPSLTLSTSAVHKGQVVKLTGTSYPTAKTTIGVTICGFPPSGTNCDVNLPDVGTINYNGSGGFTYNYTVKTTSFGSVDCAKVQCVIGTNNLQNFLDQSYSAVAMITVVATPASAPGKAKITKAKARGKTAVLVKWRKAMAHGTPVTKYRVEVKKRGAHWSHWRKAGLTSASTTRLLWKHAKAGHVYKFRVIAKSAAGSSTSNTVKVKTKK